MHIHLKSKVILLLYLQNYMTFAAHVAYSLHLFQLALTICNWHYPCASLQQSLPWSPSVRNMRAYFSCKHMHWGTADRYSWSPASAAQHPFCELTCTHDTMTDKVPNAHILLQLGMKGPLWSTIGSFALSECCEDMLTICLAGSVKTDH